MWNNSSAVERQALDTDDERVLAHCRAQYASDVAVYAPALATQPLQDTTIDMVLYCALTDRHRPQEDTVASIAFALGQALVDGLGFHWYVVSDFFGKEYAVYHDKTEDVVYPFSLVQQKLDKNELGFPSKLYAMYYQKITAQLR